MSVLALTYHAVELGPPPLCLDPGLFREQLDAIVDVGVPTLTVSQLADALRAGQLPEHAVVLTFDDGAASVARVAAPLLAEHGLTGTVFCVASYLGRRNDWPTQRPGAARFELASAAELAATGLEIGSHGVEHTPLDRENARREVVESREALEHALQIPVTSFAYPYGVVGAEELVRANYDAACGVSGAEVRPGSDPYAIPRVDVHYLRNPHHLRAALDGSLGPYLAARRLAARGRRVIRRDYR